MIAVNQVEPPLFVLGTSAPKFPNHRISVHIRAPVRNPCSSCFHLARILEVGPAPGRDFCPFLLCCIT